MAAPAPHLLVVDDDTRLRALLGQYLQDRGYVVTLAASASEARELLTLFSFDLIVLDIMMPGETGLSFLKSLRPHNDMPVLMLTAMSEATDRIAGLEAGADDYLPKPFEPKELELRIDAILRRRPKPKTHLQLGRWHFDLTRDELLDGANIVHLSEVEANLLRELAKTPGQPVNREDLAARFPMVGNARTIDVQVTRLRRKFEADPRQPRYLITVRGEGYMLRPDE